MWIYLTGSLFMQYMAVGYSLFYYLLLTLPVQEIKRKWYTKHGNLIMEILTLLKFHHKVNLFKISMEFGIR